MFHKISYAIAGEPGSGLIRNEDRLPQPGEIVKLGDNEFEVVEVIELIPARGDWGYYHVTCTRVKDGER